MAVVMTFNAAGNIIATATSIGAGANTSASFDGSTKFETQLTVKSTGGGTVAATNGCKVEIFSRYGTGPTDVTIANPLYTIPTVVSTAASLMARLGPGKYTVKLTNLDASNAITVEVTTATVD